MKGHVLACCPTECVNALMWKTTATRSAVSTALDWDYKSRDWKGFQQPPQVPPCPGCHVHSYTLVINHSLQCCNLQLSNGQISSWTFSRCEIYLDLAVLHSCQNIVAVAGQLPPTSALAVTSTQIKDKCQEQ